MKVKKVHELYVLSSRWWWMWEKPVCTWRMCEHPWVVHLSVSSWIPDYCNQDRVPRLHINTQRTHILYVRAYFKRTYVFTVLSVCARFGRVCCQRSYLQQRPLCEHWRKLPLCLQRWIWDFNRWQKLSRSVKLWHLHLWSRDVFKV